MAAGAWKCVGGVVRAARTGLDLLPGLSGAEAVAAAGVTMTAVRWWCGLAATAGGGAVR